MQWNDPSVHCVNIYVPMIIAEQDTVRQESLIIIIIIIIM